MNALAQKAAAASPLNFGRIAKPLRGGGGAAVGASSGPPAIQGGSANPLSRLQNEEAGWVLHSVRPDMIADQRLIAIFSVVVCGEAFFPRQNPER